MNKSKVQEKSLKSVVTLLLPATVIPVCLKDRKAILVPFSFFLEKKN